MLTVACVLVRANVPFDMGYVERLRDGVRRHLPRQHRLVVLTDQPGDVPGDAYAVRVPTPRGWPGWWSKLELFNPRHGLRGSTLYLDLDVLPVNSVEPIVDHDGDFSLVPDAGNWRGRDGLKVVKRFNSSVMRFDAGPTYHHLYTEWTEDVTRRLWGDQDWIGERLPRGERFPIEWFPRLSELRFLDAVPTALVESELRRRLAKIVLCKKPKNREAAASIPWVRDLWRTEDESSSRDAGREPRDAALCDERVAGGLRASGAQESAR